MPNLLPFKQYDENDVVNLFSFSGTLPVKKGTFVKPVASGWQSDVSTTQMIGPIGAQFPNTFSQRWGNVCSVAPAGTGDNVIGMLLYDVAETDENGRSLKYEPRKAAEMQVALSGQTVPIATRGLFLWSGTINGGPTAGAIIYPSGNGDLTVNPVNQTAKLGKLLGQPNGKGHALVYLNVT